MSEHKEQQPLEWQLRTPQEAAGRLGISIEALRDLVGRGDLRPTRLSARRLRFAEGELRKYVEAWTA